MNPCRRILVVDDHPDTAQSMAAVLRHMGHLVEYSLSGHAALEIARKFRPEIAFLDMLLPDFDGSNLSRLLRLKVEPQPMRIIAITGSGGEEARERAMRAGCDAFLMKPLDWIAVGPHLL